MNYQPVRPLTSAQWMLGVIESGTARPLSEDEITDAIAALAQVAEHRRALDEMRKERDQVRAYLEDLRSENPLRFKLVETERILGNANALLVECRNQIAELKKKNQPAK